MFSHQIHSLHDCFFQIIFHLFCAYMDSQLMPLPQPGGRPFYNRYVVFGDKKAPKETIEEVRFKSKFAVLCTNPAKPKFNFICDDKIHNCNHVSLCRVTLSIHEQTVFDRVLFCRNETTYSVWLSIFWFTCANKTLDCWTVWIWDAVVWIYWESLKTKLNHAEYFKLLFIDTFSMIIYW